MIMDLVTLLDIASTPGKTTSGYLAYPSIQRLRWLVPDHCCSDYAIHTLYRPTTFRGKFFKRFLSLGLYVGERVSLNDAILRELTEEISRLLRRNNILLAFSVGTPGAYQKGTIHVIAENGEVIAYAKIADGALARDALNRERAMLQQLAALVALNNHVPTVLGSLTWRNCQILLTSAGPIRPGPSELCHTHVRFLRDLQQGFSAIALFKESPMWRKLVHDSDSLNWWFPSSWRIRYRRALGTLDSRLGPKAIPLSLAHRDFAPWNTALGPNGLYVFDWETAEYGAHAFVDIFHFDAIQAALASRMRYRPDGNFVKQLGESLWPSLEIDPHLLYLAYLTDISLYYANARAIAPQTGEDRVLNWFGHQIDRALE